MADINYTPQFKVPEWRDNVDLVTAEGPNGFNDQFRYLRSELEALSGVVEQLNAALHDLTPGTVTASGLITANGGLTVTTKPVTLPSASIPSNYLNLTKSTDTNGWTKYDYGTFQQYRKKVGVEGQNIDFGRADFMKLSSDNLPVGMSSLGRNYINASALMMTNAHTLGWNFEMAGNSTKIQITGRNNGVMAFYNQDKPDEKKTMITYLTYYGYFHIVITTP